MEKSHSVRLPAHRVLDRVMEQNGLKNDAALARHLKVQPPVISKLRHNRLPFGDGMVLKAHEHGGLAVAEIRQLLAA